MSAIVLIPVLLPVAGAATWPLLVAAAGVAAANFGYQAVMSGLEAKTKANANAATRVDVDVPNADEVAGGLGLGAELAFAKDGVTVTFVRDVEGKMSVRVEGHGKSEAELSEIGRAMANGLVQQYAYHRIVTEMKSRGMSVVDEEVEEDGTVRLQVRVFQN